MPMVKVIPAPTSKVMIMTQVKLVRWPSAKLSPKSATAMIRKKPLNQLAKVNGTVEKLVIPSIAK